MEGVVITSKYMPVEAHKRINISDAEYYWEVGLWEEGLDVDDKGRVGIQPKFKKKKSFKTMEEAQQHIDKLDDLWLQRELKVNPFFQIYIEKEDE